MYIKPKFGIIVFLDALGARTTDIRVSKDYLHKVSPLRTRIIEMKSAFGEADMELDEFNRVKSELLTFRFFGDSVLIAYELPLNRAPERCMQYVFFITSMFICSALELGILFRGAISIGDYLESGSVFLGPAITDAANWYDQSDMIGALVTPAALNYLKATLGIDMESSQEEIEAPLQGLLLYDVPISRSARNENRTLRTYAADWPDMISMIRNDQTDDLSWFYNKIKSLPVPIGAESKYANSEAFIKLSQARHRPGPKKGAASKASANVSK